MPRSSPPVDVDPPKPVSFRTEVYSAGTAFPSRREPWGELHYSLSGVAEFTIEGARYLSPPQYGIWIPVGTEHHARSGQEVRYVSIYLDAKLCTAMPDKPCTLELDPLIKAILAHFAARGVNAPKTHQDKRLADVLVDQIQVAPRRDTYLPLSEDALLSPVLAALQDDPGDRRGLAEWAHAMGTTERTLSRRCQRELGMSFNEWRQRLKLVAALSMLEADQPIHRIAQRLGYGTSSAFIAMFHQLTGESPAQMRKIGGTKLQE